MTKNDVKIGINDMSLVESLKILIYDVFYNENQEIVINDIRN